MVHFTEQMSPTGFIEHKFDIQTGIVRKSKKNSQALRFRNMKIFVKFSEPCESRESLKQFIYYKTDLR